MRQLPQRRAENRGQALVEFACVLPIFLLMLFAIIDVGRVVWANDSLANAAREAARYAIVHGGSDTTTDPVGPGLTKQPIVDTAHAFAIAAGDNLVVQVCYGEGCTGDNDTTASNARGTPVTVTVRSEVSMLTGSLVGFAPLAVSATSTMVVNN